MKCADCNGTGSNYGYTTDGYGIKQKPYLYKEKKRTCATCKGKGGIDENGQPTYDIILNIMFTVVIFGGAFLLLSLPRIFDAIYRWYLSLVN